MQAALTALFASGAVCAACKRRCWRLLQAALLAPLASGAVAFAVAVAVAVAGAVAVADTKVNCHEEALDMRAPRRGLVQAALVKGRLQAPLITITANNNKQLIIMIIMTAPLASGASEVPPQVCARLAAAAGATRLQAPLC